MESPSASREGVTKVFRNLILLTTVSLLIGLWLALPEATSGQKKEAAKEEATSGQKKEAAKEAKLQHDWHMAMLKVPHPKKEGTFEATYPKKEWREVKSIKPPHFPAVPPGSGPRPLVAGGTNDLCAQVPNKAFISSATGSFDKVTGVTGVSSQLSGNPPEVDNAYSIQLNTNTFPSTFAGSPPGCQGWEQFLFMNDGTSGSAFIQYWLIRYGKTSPGPGWNYFRNTNGDDDWWINSTMGSAVPNQPYSNLANLRLSGTVSATSDGWVFSTGTKMVSGTGDNLVKAAAGWNVAQFCVVGHDSGARANFKWGASGAKIVPRTQINYGGTAPPNCVVSGFTAETNNLNYGPTAPGASKPGPAIIGEESSLAGAMMSASCSDASSVGDTHLTTFHGLLYDFQSSGDFVLAHADPDFVVQTRQVSGAPNWPHASVNSAVATQMGKTKVAISVGKQRLIIDRKPTNLADGKSISTADGVDVTRRGNVYFIVGKNGDSVRATLHEGPKMNWIDVLVGLGHCGSKAKAKGLLANANDDVHQLAARDGTVLKNPFAFKDLYHRYGESWRVSPKESLLSVFGHENVETAHPKKLFYAHHLDAEVHKDAHAAAKAAGVKHDAHHDAATLDVAVLGTEKAAHVFVGMHPPVAVGKIVGEK
jgi:hypothetical protein